MVSTRLPAPEMDFQSSKPLQMSFLSEVIVLSEHATLSSFTKCIIVVTIYGRTMAHQQQSKVECVYNNASEDFWNRHHWLDAILTQQELINGALSLPNRRIHALEKRRIPGNRAGTSKASVDCRVAYKHVDKTSIAAQLLQGKFFQTCLRIFRLLEIYRHN